MQFDVVPEYFAHTYIRAIFTMLLEIRNISKSFGNEVALSGLSFQIPANTVFGLLGPNGAGKTSLIRIVTKILTADSGEVLFQGHQIHEADKKLIGYMPEERGLYSSLRVGEQVLYLARLKGLTKAQAKSSAQHWLERFGALDWWDRRIEELSKGMQQKVQFIATVIHKPQLIIFDEPFAGLDPINTELFRSEILNLRDGGATILFSTHQMEQEEICDEIVLINKGRKLLNGTVQEIKQRFKRNNFRIRFRGNLDKINDSLGKIVEQYEDEAIIQLGKGQSSSNLLNGLTKNIELFRFEEVLPSLHEIFINEVGKENDTERI